MADIKLNNKLRRRKATGFYKRAQAIIPAAPPVIDVTPSVTPSNSGPAVSPTPTPSVAYFYTANIYTCNGPSCAGTFQGTATIYNGGNDFTIGQFYIGPSNILYQPVQRTTAKPTYITISSMTSYANCTLACNVVNPSPTPSVTPSITITPSVTRTPSVTPTITSTPSVTPSITPTITSTPSVTPSITVSPSIPGSPSVTPSITVSPSVTPSVTPSITVSPSVTRTPSITPSVTPSITVSPSVTPTPSPSAYYIYYGNGYICGDPCTYNTQQTIGSNSPLSIGSWYKVDGDTRAYQIQGFDFGAPGKTISDPTAYASCLEACAAINPSPSPSATPSITVTPSVTPSQP